jgi:hypothetical protein
MCRTAACIRLRASGRRVRRTGPADRCRLEGARATSARRLGGGGRRGHRGETRRGRAHLCSRRSRSAAAARTPRGGASGRGARGSLGASVRRASGQKPRLPTAARPDAVRTPSQHVRRVPGPGARSRQNHACRRRLHHGRYGERGCVCTATGRSQVRRGRDLRPHDSHALRSEHRLTRRPDAIACEG